MSDELFSERRGRTLVITINRPGARNAINRAVSVGLAEAVLLLDEDPALSVAVVTGAGGHFCAGMDLKAFVSGEDIAVPGLGLGFTERPPLKPIIAAVEGFALAGGTELALATDLIVAARDARFGIPEVRRGLVAGGGGLFRLPQRIPYLKAMELALTGDSITAEQGLTYGLVNIVTERGEALAGALELADRIARNGPLAVAATKQIVAAAQDWGRDEAFARQSAIIAPVFASADAREGAVAFAEKRQPIWQGR
jgi:enoyl-CoA hydratase/carnithine racemase